jgi:hypothetical protein
MPEGCIRSLWGTEDLHRSGERTTGYTLGHIKDGDPAEPPWDGFPSWLDRRASRRP